MAQKDIFWPAGHHAELLVPVRHFARATQDERQRSVSRDQLVFQLAAETLERLLGIQQIMCGHPAVSVDERRPEFRKCFSNTHAFVGRIVPVDESEELVEAVGIAVRDSDLVVNKVVVSPPFVVCCCVILESLDW